MDTVTLDRLAVQESLRLLATVRPDQWELPTPCTAWTLRQLVSHMAGQHEGFAASAAGGDDLAAWRDIPVGDHPYETYRASAERALAAFAEDCVMDRTFRLPEVIKDLDFPAAFAIGFHLLDHVVHSWDIAAALGVALRLPDEAIEASLPIAALVPEDEGRHGPDAMFRPAVPAAPDASALDRLLSTLGRTPIPARP